jgi:Ser/Thr protein kinase RdoA (MazF antagonist)
VDGPYSDTERLAQHLADRYRIRPGNLTVLDGGVFRVEREDDPAWVARVFHADRPVARAEGEAAVLRVLEQKGYPSERCAHADPVSTLDGRAVLITEFVEGALPGKGGRSSVPLTTFEALGELLGMLHDMSGLPRETQRDAGSWHGDPEHEGLPSEDVVAARSWLDAVEARVPDAARGPYDTLLDYLDATADLDDLPRTLIHPDFVPVNAIERPDGRITIVDWTGAGLGPRVASVANLLWSVVGNHAGSMSARVNAVVAGYRAHVWLEDEELARLADAMWIRPLLFACWYYRSSLSSGYIPKGTEPWWPNRNRIDWVAARARRAFGAEVLARPSVGDSADGPKPEIPGQLSLDVPTP